MKRLYESMLILMPDLGDDAREEVIQKITKKIESLDGKMVTSRMWAKDREFRYCIKGRGAEKKKCYKGCYWLMEFELDTEKLPDLKETLRLEERILRNIILKREKSKIAVAAN